MYMVLGANGRAGGETARALIENGAAVRVLLRRPEQAPAWTARGAEVAIGSLEDGPSLVAALRGTAGAFLLSPPPVAGDPYRRADDFGRALAEAVRRAEVPAIVALSSVGAQHATGTGIVATLNTLERHLGDAAPSVTVLRPGYFVETWGEVAPAAIATGRLPSFLEPALPIPMVSTVDIGRLAARLLLDGASPGRRIVELAGPERDWSAADVAAAFATILDRPVEVAFVPPEARAAVLAETGVPPEVAAALLGLYEGLATGRVARQPGTDHRRGTVGLVEAVERLLRQQAGGMVGAVA